jgi:hypothetical protein
MMLSRITETKREEFTTQWRKLRNEELHNLHASPSIMRVTKSRRM